MRHEDITNVVYELEQNFLSSVKTKGFKGKFSSLKEAEEKLSRLKKESYGPEHYLENLLEFKNHGILPWEEAEGKESQGESEEEEEEADAEEAKGKGEEEEEEADAEVELMIYVD